MHMSEAMKFGILRRALFDYWNTLRWEDFQPAYGF